MRFRRVRSKMASGIACAVLAGAAGGAEPAIEQIAWLAGCWESDGGEPGSGERWTPFVGETLLGVSRTIREGKTVAFEFMEIRHLPNGKLAFIAHPSGQKTVVFAAVHSSETEVVFENLEHDFPQRVVYARGGQSKLRARIEGSQGGALRVIEFPMSRRSCD